MIDKNTCKTCIWYDGLACMNNQEICVDNSAYMDETDVIHDICAEERDHTRRDMTIKALKNLFTLYHNSNYVAHKISEEETRIEGYTRHSFSELENLIDLCRSRYGYYCSISFMFDPCCMLLTIEVKERRVD